MPNKPPNPLALIGLKGHNLCVYDAKVIMSDKAIRGHSVEWVIWLREPTQEERDVFEPAWDGMQRSKMSVAIGEREAYASTR